MIRSIGPRVALAGLLLAACAPTDANGGASPSALPAFSDGRSATVPPTLTVNVRSPTLIRRVSTGSGDLPGVSPPAPGGIPAAGVGSVATEGTLLFLWDQANRRILVYGPDRLESTLAVPTCASRELSRSCVAPDARSLMVTADKLYVRIGGTGQLVVDYELDRRDGRLLRTAWILQGEAPLYPRDPPQLRFDIGKDESESLGMDGRGRRYERIARSSCQPVCGNEIRRLDAREQALLRVITPDYSLRWEDVSISDDGRVVGLHWVWEGANLVAIEVYELLPAAP